jgi:hypothetical protein
VSGASGGANRAQVRTGCSSAGRSTQLLRDRRARRNRARRSGAGARPARAGGHA